MPCYFDKGQNKGMGFLNFHLTKSTVAAAALLITSTASASLASDFYIEGQLGSVDVKDVSTPAYSGTASGLTFSNFKAGISYDSDTFLGVELGYNVAPNTRVGLSYSSFSLNWNAITGSGTVSDGTTTVNLSTTLNRGTLDNDGLLDNSVKLMMANAYYDIPLDGAINPFVGVGLGKADISNAGSETALSFSIGANYDVGESNYFGVKYTRYSVNGPTDGLGLKYDDIKADAVNISYGYRF